MTEPPPKKRKVKRSDLVVQPVECKKEDDAALPIKGEFLFPGVSLYGSVFLAGSSGLGKTTTLAHILPRTTQKHDQVYIMSATIHVDPIWQQITEDLEKRKVHCVKFDSLYGSDGRTNVLEGLLKTFADMDQGDETPKVDNVPIWIATNHTQVKDKVVKKKKKKFQTPYRTLVLDDLSSKELRSQAILDVLRRSRHFKVKVYISSQAILAILPASMQQLSVICVWKGMSEHYMKELHSRISCSIPWEDFYALYREITDIKHQFMSIYTRTGAIRMSFFHEDLAKNLTE
jgi:hypothetical protein